MSLDKRGNDEDNQSFKRFKSLESNSDVESNVDISLCLTNSDLSSNLIEHDEFYSIKKIDHSFEDTDCETKLEELRSILELNESSLILFGMSQIQSNKYKIKSLIKEFELRSCWLDCLEIFHFNQLFGTILAKLLDPDLDIDEFNPKIFDIMNVNTIHNFIDTVKSKLKKIKYKNFILTLDNAEILVKRHPDFFGLLVGINEQVKDLKIITVMISSYRKEHFRNIGFIFKEIYEIEFPLYSLDQIEKLIIMHRPDSFPIQIYSSFVGQVCGFLLNVCTNYDKLKYICEKYFIEYKNENLTGNQIKNQIGFLKNNFNNIIFNVVFNADDKLNLVHELTYCGKCLLISAYVASFNSKSTDKRFFSKFQDKNRKRGRQSAFAKKEDQICGPKKFTFERVYQIYISIQNLTQSTNDCDEMKTQSPTNHFFGQFQTFISQKLILVSDSLSSHSPYSSSSKYCIADFISHEFVNKLAKSIDIELDEFLEANLIK